MNDRAIPKDTDIVKADSHSSAEIELIHNMYAKNSTKEEFELFLYTANKFGLDPLLKQIWCVKFANQNAQIYAGRDGFLEIAHRSGVFNGIESGMKNNTTAYAKVYRKDMTNPFYVEVDMAEYSTNQALWKTKPKTMLTKVAESQALRRAFSITGIYSPEEMGQWELEAQGIKYDTNTPKAINTTNNTATESNPFEDDIDYGLDPMTYKLTGGKFAGQRLIDCSTAYIEWTIGKAKESTYAMTYDKVPMPTWISFLEACLAIHIANKEKPVAEAEPEFIDIETAPQEDLEEVIEHFEKTLGAVETPQSIAHNKIKKALNLQ